MNDFFIATNKSVFVEVLEQAVEVRQIQIKDFDHWLICAEPIKQAIANKDHSDEILLEVVIEHVIHAAQLCALVTDFSIEIILKLMKDSETEFLKLFNAAIQVNGAYFEQDPKTSMRKNSNDSSTWFDSFQYLIRNGHSHESIMQMSYGAFKQYLKCAQKSEHQRMAMLANSVRYAQHSSANEFMKYIDNLIG